MHFMGSIDSIDARMHDWQRKQINLHKLKSPVDSDWVEFLIRNVRAQALWRICMSIIWAGTFYFGNVEMYAHFYSIKW